MTPTMQRTLRALLFAATAAGALSAHGVCDAADAAPGPDGGAVAAAAAPSGVGDIVVTAQRRNESVQKVPMTIQALTGRTLSVLNITTFDTLLKYTPNISYGNNGAGQGEIYMRGLSAGFRGNQSSATVGNFPNVAIYLDDQSMQFPARNVDIYMADMDRVEVLEGPQGTLFGGSAEAGAVRYITNKPNLSQFSGNAEVSGGFTDGGGPNASVQVISTMCRAPSPARTPTSATSISASRPLPANAPMACRPARPASARRPIQVRSIISPSPKRIPIRWTIPAGAYRCAMRSMTTGTS
jgi:outer membrane receptor protein involved in Fe transport